MHNYSVNSEERKSVPFWLAIISIGIAWILGSLPIPWWLDAPAVMGSYFVLYAWVDKKLWKASFFRRILSIKTPIIEGTWTGNLDSSTEHPGGIGKGFEMTICQTWTEMKILLDTDTSHSYSIEGSIVLDHADTPVIYYQYENHPKHGAAETMHIHKGSVHARIISQSEIYSEYYSGRDRLNTGSFKAVKQNNAKKIDCDTQV